MLLHILTNKKKNYVKDIKYIRVLGMNKKGKEILKEAKKNTCLPIITKYKKEFDYLFKDDIKASKIYSLITVYDYKEEFKSSITK